MIRRTTCLIANTDQIYRNQAIEAILSETLTNETACLFLWQAPNAVMQGCLEDTRETCREELLSEKGGLLARRITGGTSAWLDNGVLNYAIIVPREDFSIPRQNALLGTAAAMLGIGAVVGPMGTMTVAGRVFSTPAFHKQQEVAIQHGTILVNCDLSRAVTYLPEINTAAFVNLQDLNPEITVEKVQQCLYLAMEQVYGAQPVWLNEQMLGESSIAGREASFRDENWLMRTAENTTFRVSERFPWGRATVCMRVEGGIIRYCTIFTDALESFLFDAITAALQNCPFLISGISNRFAQRLQGLHDPRLIQISSDLCKLICGHIRQSDRRGEGLYE